MRVFLDECVNWRVIRLLPDHEVKSAKQMGWEGIKNGELLELVERQFDVFLTTDRNLAFQQNVAKRTVAVVVLRVPTNSLMDIKPLLPRLLEALKDAPTGAVTMVE